MAMLVGKRRDRQPIVLIVDSFAAYNDGISFYFAGDGVWLADEIPVKYIKEKSVIPT